MCAHVSGAQTPRDQRDAELERPEVTSLTIRGVRAVQQDELRNSIATDASHCRSLIFRPFCVFTKSHYFYERNYLDREQLRLDVLRMRVFYWKRGYRDATVDTLVTRAGRGAVKVVFRVAEGPPTLVTAIHVEGARPILSRRQVRKALVLRRNDPLDLLRLDSSRVRLTQALWDKGYGDAVVDTSLTVDDSARRGRIAFRVDPRRVTTVRAIRVGQTREVDKGTILHSLTLRPGDIYKHSEVVRSQRNLYESNLFRRATVRPEPPPDSTASVDSAKTLLVDVTEAPLREARVSGGFNTADFGQLDARFTHYNFLGGARRMNVDGAVGNLVASALNGEFIFRDVTKSITGDAGPFLQPTWHTSIDFTQPWFYSSHNSLGAGIFAHRRTAPGVFIDRGYGASATFTRELAVRAPSSLTYRFEVSRVEAGDVYFCVNYGVCDLGTIDALRVRQRLSPFSLTSTVDRSNDPFSPSHGYMARLELEHASAYTASDFRYNRALAELSRYFGFGRNVIAGHVRAGWVKALASTAQAVGVANAGIESDILHPRKRFYAGGSQSVRGFGENQLGPRILTIPPSQLAKLGCDTSFAGVASCDPNAPGVDPKTGNATSIADRDFTPRPLGGTTLLEGGLEWRFPIWKQLGGATFVDGGLVGEHATFNLHQTTGAITPGVGVRYYSPVGPIRVDVGYNPSLAEDLRVVTQAHDGNTLRVVTLNTMRHYAPATGFLSHLTVHLSIGQAF